MVRPILIALACLLAACATREPRQECAAIVNRPQGGTEIENRVLSEGYSQLYDTVRGLGLIETGLVFKRTSKPTRAVIKNVSEYASGLKQQLEDIEAQYPSLTIHDNGLPLAEVRKREGERWDRVKAMAPFAGATGPDFERSLLLSETAVLNHTRFLAKALADLEKNEQRKEFATGVQHKFDRYYAEVVALLDRKYFRQGAHTPVGPAGEMPH
jgi:hypothetical protein